MFKLNAIVKILRNKNSKQIIAATKIFIVQFPKKEITGYWVTTQGVVINTKQTYRRDGEALQFLIDKNGRIVPINPTKAKLRKDEYVKI